jgi:hypothetical protein
LVIRMHLVHLYLTCLAGPAPDETDAALVHDALWAPAPPSAGIEHIRARAGPEGIDLSLFLRSDIRASDPKSYARTLFDILARNSRALSTWHVTDPR